MNENGPTSGRDDDGVSDLARVVELTLALRTAVSTIPNPLLHQFVDLILIELGRSLSNDQT